MKVVLMIMAVALFTLVVFTAANWNVLNANTELSFVAFSVEGPMGVILLGIMLGLVILVVVYALLLRTAWLVESRRLNRQLEKQRELAEKAESSRIAALHELVEREFKEARTSTGASSETVVARLEGLEQSVAQKIEDAANSIMAHLGYLDDKLKGGS
ncbi:MAG: hypothetical protein ABII79_13330 [bacterium]